MIWFSRSVALVLTGALAWPTIPCPSAVPAPPATYAFMVCSTDTLTLALSETIRPFIAQPKLIATALCTAGMTPATARKYGLQHKMHEYQAITTSEERRRALGGEIAPIFSQHAPIEEKPLFAKLKPALRLHLPGVYRRFNRRRPRSRCRRGSPPWVKR